MPVSVGALVMTLMTGRARRNLSANNLQGGLPSNWARTGVFPNLTTLDLSSNPRLNGVVIAQWGTQGAFASLQARLMRLRSIRKALQDMVRSGTLDAFPLLQACLPAAAAAWCQVCLHSAAVGSHAAKGPEELRKRASEP